MMARRRPSTPPWHARSRTYLFPRSAWEHGLRRSASRASAGPRRSASVRALPRGAWERGSGSMSQFLRPAIRAMAGYTPGEQPRDGGYIKLNTNENPYPPSPRALNAIREALAGGDRLRKYPDPVGLVFRQTAGRVLGIDPDSILIGNGSDDILTIITRAFVPEGGLVVSATPSYLLYRTLAELQGAHFETVPYTPDWQLPRP